MKKIFLFVFLFTSLAVSAQKVIKVSGGGLDSTSTNRVTKNDSTNGALNMTLAQLQASTTIPSGKPVNIIDDPYKGVVIYTPGSTAIDDGGGRNVRDGLGRVFTRITAGGTYYVDQFNVIGDGLTDNTARLQAAVNACKNSRLLFTPGKVYLTNQVYIPPGITLDGQGATVAPYLPTKPNSNIIFAMVPIRLNYATDSLYGGGTSYPGTRALRKVFKNVIIRNFNFDAKYTTTLFTATSQLNSWQSVEDILIENINMINISGNGINLFGGTTYNDSTGFGKNITVNNPHSINSGYFCRIIVDGDYAVGATSLKLRSLDPTIPLYRKVKVGIPIQVCTKEIYTLASGNGYLESNSTYNGSNQIFRVASYTQDPTDSLAGTITITSGNYSSTTGYSVDATNVGLKSPVVKGAGIIATAPYEFALINRFPNMNTTSGSTTFTYTDLSTATQQAYYANIVDGMQFSLTAGSGGVFTVVSHTSTTITTDIPALATSTNSGAIVLGTRGNSIAYDADMRNIIVNDADFIGAGLHGFYITGKSGRGMYWNDLKSTLIINRPHISGAWIGIEAFMNNGPVLLPITASGFAITAGDSVLTLTTPASFKVTTNDIDGDGVGDTAISASAPTPTLSNTLTTGDVIRILGMKYLWRIRSINTSSPYAMTLVRYNTDIKQDIGTGFPTTIAVSGALNRVYSRFQGACENMYSLTINGGLIENMTRNSQGYAVSAFPNILNINGLATRSYERVPFEVGGDRMTMKDGTSDCRLWNGETDGPGRTSYPGGVAARGAGRAMSLSATNPTITNWKWFNNQPDSNIYNSQNGDIYTNDYGGSPSEAKAMIITGNRLEGLTGRIIFANVLQSVGGVNYPIQNYESQDVSENNCYYLSAAANASVIGMHMYAGKVNVTNNKLHFNKTPTSAVFFERDAPNPNYFPTYRPTFMGNTLPAGINYSPTPATLNGAGDIKYNSPDNVTAPTSYTGTPGRIPFPGVNGNLTERANFFVDSTNNRLGIGTQAPTAAITLTQNSTGIDFHNLSTLTTNTEVANLKWISNTFSILTSNTGTGVARPIQIGTPTRLFNIGIGGLTGFFNFATTNGSGGQAILGLTGSDNLTSGTVDMISVRRTLNSSGTSGYKALLVDVYEQAFTGTGPALLLDLGRNSAATGTGTHTPYLTVDRVGKIYMAGTPTGTTAMNVLVKGSDSLIYQVAFPSTSGGTPGGSNTHIQYNSAGAFAGSGNLTWDNTNGIETITGVGLKLNGTPTGTTSMKALVKGSDSIVRQVAFPTGTTPGGSNSQIQFNNGGVFGAFSDVYVSGTSHAVIAPHTESSSTGATANAYGSGVTSVTIDGTDEAMVLTVTTSGAVSAGTGICNITLGTPLISHYVQGVFGARDAAAANASSLLFCANSGGTSYDVLRVGASISGAGTYSFVLLTR